MKQITLICMFVISMFFVSFAQAQTQLTISTVKGLPVVEVYSNFMKQAYQQIGIKINVKLLPAKRSMDTANKGEVDGELVRAPGISKKFPNLVSVPVPIGKLEVVVMSKKKDLTIKGWKALSPYKIGIFRGFVVTDINTKGMTRQIVNSPKSLFEILKRDRVDLIVFIRIFASHFMKANPGYEMIHFIEPPLLKIPLFHYLHKKNRNLIPKLTPIFKKMAKEKVFDKLLLAYEKKTFG